jgi:hypothetical protein
MQANSKEEQAEDKNKPEERKDYTQRTNAAIIKAVVGLRGITLAATRPRTRRG